MAHWKNPLPITLESLIYYFSQPHLSSLKYRLIFTKHVSKIEIIKKKRSEKDKITETGFGRNKLKRSTSEREKSS